MTRVAVIAGVGPTIGAAVARRFHEDGFAVGLLARTEEYVRTLADDLGDGAVAIPTDVTDEAAVRSAVERVRDQLGPVEVLVLNAAAGGGNPVDDASADRLRELFDVRVAGSMACVRAALPDLRKTEGAVLFSGTTYAEPPVTAQVEWGAVAPAARGLAVSLDAALDDVSVTYVRIGSAVRPEAGPTAIAASEVAAEYRRLVSSRGVATRELDVRKR